MIAAFFFLATSTIRSVPVRWEEESSRLPPKRWNLFEDPLIIGGNEYFLNQSGLGHPFVNPLNHRLTKDIDEGFSFKRVDP
jgi:hypothetical protein